MSIGAKASIGRAACYADRTVLHTGRQRDLDAHAAKADDG